MFPNKSNGFPRILMVCTDFYGSLRIQLVLKQFKWLPKKSDAVPRHKLMMTATQTRTHTHPHTHTHTCTHIHNPHKEIQRCIATLVIKLYPDATQRDATQRDATQRDATQRDATQRDATQGAAHLGVGLSAKQTDVQSVQQYGTLVAGH